MVTNCLYGWCEAHLIIFCGLFVTWCCTETLKLWPGLCGLTPRKFVLPRRVFQRWFLAGHSVRAWCAHGNSWSHGHCVAQAAAIGTLRSGCWCFHNMQADLRNVHFCSSLPQRSTALARTFRDNNRCFFPSSPSATAARLSIV